ncbi:MAG: hypothetical protein QOI24_4661 [Acidobacteriota bacterium]|jgi:5-hydroxyisourate hydrolase-like protein (transthyretin family)|nr:hypothetical protein [Acidobacteriota bacterium]
MKSFSLFVLSLLLSIAAHAATIGGTVTNETSAPLGGMTVAAWTTGGVLASSGSTTASGTYSLTVPAGSFHLLAYDPSGAYATSFYADAESFDTSATIAVTSAQNVTNINLRLVRSGFITGRVTTFAGAALPNLTVTAYNLSGTWRGFTSSDANGNFTLALPPGTYKLAAQDDTLNYVTTFFDDATSFANATAVTVVSAQSIVANVQLPRAVKLTGIVVDRNTLAPLAGVRVTAWAADGSIAAQSLTASNGRFAMAAGGGMLRVVVDDPNGSYATTFVPDAESFSTESAVSAIAGQTMTIDATMVRGARLAGTITDRNNAQPLANITAVAYNADGTTRASASSAANGSYSILMPPGDFRVGVFDAALVRVPLFYPSATTFAAATLLHAIAQQTIDRLDFAMTKGARVTAHVTAKTSGAPLAAITVGAYDAGGLLLASANSDASGTATLLVAPGTVKLLAFDAALQFAPAYYLDAATFDTTRLIALAEGESLTASFSMTDAGRLSGSVVDNTTGVPLSDISVIVYDMNLQRITETTTDDGGAFRIAVQAGTYFVAAGDPSHRYAGGFYGGATAASVTVRTGQESGLLRIELAAAAAHGRRRAAGH